MILRKYESSILEEVTNLDKTAGGFGSTNKNTRNN